MKIDPGHITATLLRNECGHGAYERGRGYFHQLRTTLDSIEMINDRLHLVATTRGSGRSRYQQNIDITTIDNHLVIEGGCTCPVGYNCKHVVSACLTYKDRAPALVPTEQPNDTAFSIWLDHLNAGVSLMDDENHRGQDFLLYHLSPSAQAETFEIGLGRARMRKDGTFGKENIVHFTSLSGFYSFPAYFTTQDEEIIGLLKISNRHAWSGCRLSGVTGRSALEQMARSQRLFLGKGYGQPLQWGTERTTRCVWREEKANIRLDLALDEQTSLIRVSPPLYLDTATLEVGALIPEEGVAPALLESILKAPAVRKLDAARISRMLALRYPSLPTPVEVDVHEISDIHPTPRLTISGEFPHDARIMLEYLYDTIAVGGDERVIIVERGTELLRIHRDKTAEAEAVAVLLATGLEQDSHLPAYFTAPIANLDRQAALRQWFDIIEHTLAQLEGAGWLVTWAQGEAPFLSQATNIDAEIDTSENDWFGLRFDIEVNGRRLPLLPLVSELIGNYQPDQLPPTLYLDDGNGRFIAIDSARIEPVIQTIIDLYDRDIGDTLRLSRLDAPRLLDLGEITVRGGNELMKLAQRLRNFDGIKEAKLPTTFKGELRRYQHQGVNWLQFLREYALAGILADDMGLGKTVQTLAHLAIEKRAGRMKLPSLIIAPTSLMGNWRREAGQFTPNLKVLVLHGPNRGEHFDSLADHDLILTTYPLLPRDADTLQGYDYHYLILDEAQQIKNPKSQAAQLVRGLRASHRLCLSGTPMENHLGELWAQFDFLLPGFLGSQEQFTRGYRNPIERDNNSDRLQRLTQRTTPFMLRRTKELVASELPPKTELLRTIPIEGKQATLYESIRLSMEKRVRDAIANKGLARSHITILDALLKLRQVCCDPRLLPNSTRGAKGAESAKLTMLMELLPEMLEEGRRILLFSQFTTMLGLIEDELKPLGISYSKLTGQTRKRDEAIERFRGGEVDLFLISLKAGGIGLNLTEADTVIHYDPWWNPAVEAQATDRAYRIGQDKPVFVYKLITEGTVEEKILALQEKKRRLTDNVYGRQEKDEGLAIDADTISALLSSA